MRKTSETIFACFTLFGSTFTLICCALPIFLSVIAGASAVLSLVEALPWLANLSRYKHWIFALAGVLLLADGILLHHPKFSNAACPVSKRAACKTGKSFSKVIFWIAVGIYGIGFFFSYLLPFVVNYIDT